MKGGDGQGGEEAGRVHMVDPLILALRDLFEKMPSTCAAVIDGDGPHFCAGLDLSELESATPTRACTTRACARRAGARAVRPRAGHRCAAWRRGGRRAGLGQRLSHPCSLI